MSEDDIILLDDDDVLSGDSDLKNPAQEGRKCPNCDIEMQSVNICAKREFYIEHCEQCNGLFFDTGELETVLNRTGNSQFQMNEVGSTLFTAEPNEEIEPTEFPRCPVCGVVMSKDNFEKSAISVSSCLQHGMWLEPGQLTHFFENEDQDLPSLFEEQKSENNSSTSSETTVRKQKNHSALHEFLNRFRIQMKAPNKK